MSERGEMRRIYTKTGLVRYQVEVRHSLLVKYQLIRGDDPYVVERKALAKMAEWDAMWAKHQEREQRAKERKERAREIAEKKEHAQWLTQEAQGQLSELSMLLEHTLSVDDAIDWDSLKDRGDYPVAKPKKPDGPPKPVKPEIPPKPTPPQVCLGFLDKLFESRRLRKEQMASTRFQSDLSQWAQAKKKAIASYNERVRAYNRALRDLNKQYAAKLEQWAERRKEYLRDREEHNQSIDVRRNEYLAGDPEAIFDYCEMVLSNSQYPDYFPQSYDLDYNPENGMLIVDYELPSIEVLPTVKQVTYVQSRDEFTEKHLSQSELNRLYDGVLYQVALRTIHEVIEADTIEAIQAVVFNGYVQSVDPATGQEVHPCVLSVQASREEFLQIDLARVDPKSCFRKLKGVASAKLHTMTPVAPLLTMDRTDSRFVDSYAVVDGLNEGDNLAAMDWEDFEHLIRELFEKEFARAGGEVRVTQASRDGGVDAVAFDPDPIRGGKIVIQAKRYAHTVGVSAVRDLYGTVLNEGATKGVLVTTADYGADAYEFAKGKPLVLLNGGNLLHLLEKHGHKARINLAEARRILADGTEK